MLVANTTLLKLVENWTQLEISLGAVARVRSLENTTPSEGCSECFEPPMNWPSEGRVELANITASYRYVRVYFEDKPTDRPAPILLL
jgi:ATP-binding cassette subfamily C (CFTR/MRP) protein 1